jgi:hypothetical protein
MAAHELLIFIEAKVMANLATQFIARTYRQPYRPAKLRTITPNGKAALIEGTDAYDEFIWALARKFTNTAEEAEAAVKEMRLDMEQCAKERTRQPSNEEQLVAQIAWRRLFKFLL